MTTKTCAVCGTKFEEHVEKYSIVENLKPKMHQMNIQDTKLEELQNSDCLCRKCGSKLYSRHAVEVYNYNKKVLLPEEFEELILKGCDEDWVVIAQAELGIESPETSSESHEVKTISPSQELASSENEIRITTHDEMLRLIGLYQNKFKSQWDKDGIVQFKNESIAILQRVYGAQVQFIVAYDRVTKEGYRLMAIDEGKTGTSSAGGLGFGGGMNSYYYFQRMDFVR